jgi:hypothetical protein
MIIGMESVAFRVQIRCFLEAGMGKIMTFKGKIMTLCGNDTTENVDIMEKKIGVSGDNMARKLPISIMKRVDACAIIFTADNQEKIDLIAEYKEVTKEVAARIYIIGILKASIRRGTARSYADAIDQYEARQAGDRLNSVTMPSSITAEVSRINKINKVTGTGGRKHVRNMAKVIGSLYVQWEDIEASYDPAVVYTRSEFNKLVTSAEDEIARYMSDYVSRLSATARASLRKIVESMYSDSAIMTARDSSECSRLRDKVRYLHDGFPARDNVGANDYLKLIRKYCA